eukprot:6187367-Pleurochrysis_carterae.AAC.1
MIQLKDENLQKAEEEFAVDADGDRAVKVQTLATTVGALEVDVNCAALLVDCTNQRDHVRARSLEGVKVGQ